ncbi:hypothetical protein [Bartonella massiliensis]|uniref:hypothetical protein n=1 Tax=Bartonella massiliensis TaxID=929795 RepID=UPI001158AF26|nr:hypothetical protein [Bartonella massiliensis]
MFTKKVPLRESLLLVLFLLTYLMSVSCGYTGISEFFCSKVVKERDDAIEKLASVEFEKANAERGWNDTIRLLGIVVEDLQRSALEQQEFHLALLKGMPNNKQLAYKYELTQKRNTAIFERIKKVLTLFEHVEKRTEAFRMLNEANKLQNQSQSLDDLKVISQHDEHINKLNKELEKLGHEIDGLNNKLQNLKKISG